MIERYFAAKAPAAGDIADRIGQDAYASRFELLRDTVRYLYWAHRYFLTLYTLRSCRWQDVPMGEPDARLPVFADLGAALQTAELVARAFTTLRPAWPGDGEERILGLVAEPLESVCFDAACLTSTPPSADAAVRAPGSLVMRVPGASPLGRVPSRSEILGFSGRSPELTALLRQAGVISREHLGRWGRPDLVKIDRLRPDEFVVVAWPRSAELAEVLSSDRRQMPARPAVAPRRATRATERPGLRFSPSRGVAIAGLAAVLGELTATNEDIVANAAWHWSPMSSEDIFRRTGILERRYTERTLDELVSEAALRLLAQSDDTSDIGAVVACSATNGQLMPSLAARIADRIGLTCLAGVWDVTAACAGFPYGLAAAARIVEETGCRVLLVLGEKFSDKLGTVRSSRMIFGDGAAAMLLAPAGDTRSDVQLVRTYAGGSAKEVHSVVWPDPTFGSHLTVDGNGARSIVERYLNRILRDLGRGARNGLGGIDLVVPHQANERMVREIAVAAGIPEERLYFNIRHVGNVGGASIPIALYDAVLDGTISEKTRVLAPAFAAGALAGVSVLTVRPGIVATDPGTSCD